MPGWRPHALANVERGRRVEHEARLAAGGAHERKRAVDVAGGLRVEGDEIGAGVGEVADDRVDGRHHQVHVDRGLDAVVLERLAHHRANGQVGHEVVVHHVELRRANAEQWRGHAQVRDPPRKRGAAALGTRKREADRAREVVRGLVRALV